MKKTIIIFCGLVIIVTAAILFVYRNSDNGLPTATPDESVGLSVSSVTGGSPDVSELPIGNSTPSISPAMLIAPINRWLERVIKKPFGIKISPADSPVQPERFSGYHTGVDFEIFPEEENTDVPIFAVCDGPLLAKRTASGYGGLAVQSCRLDGQDITVIYGHLKIASISVAVEQQLSAGEQMGVLGQGYSSETDGERKHLHLGIYKGSEVNILGYVQSQAELTDWLSIIEYLPLSDLQIRL